MFTKDTEKLETVIGAESDFRGEINVKGTLRVEGRIEGRVNADWVILNETGTVRGDVTARKIIVGGTVEGNLRGQEIVEIKSSGKVSGDIFAARLCVNEGGECNGKIEMKKEGNGIAECETSPNLHPASLNL
jgi:cytoskeletal protein CcmA (bactofilin family)